MVIEAYSPAQVGRNSGGPMQPERCMSEAGLREELAGLDVVRVAEIEREISEGKYHQGLSAVVQYVGRKPT
jgi:hypothetical protein